MKFVLAVPKPNNIKDNNNQSKIPLASHSHLALQSTTSLAPVNKNFANGSTSQNFSLFQILKSSTARKDFIFFFFITIKCKHHAIVSRGLLPNRFIGFKIQSPLIRLNPQTKTPPKEKRTAGSPLIHG